VAGWKKAKQAVGDIGLRIMTTESTRADNDLIVAELASDPSVKIWHYDSLITYMPNEKQTVDSDIAAWAAAGHYAGEVPILSTSSNCYQPWTCPQFVRYRMQEYKNKSISGLMGYPTPSISYNRFNTEAAAEWSWNPDGRSAHEFAASWAVRQGLADPEAFAEWCDLMGPVSWDVYGSEFPRGELRGNSRCGPIATALQNATLQALGTYKSTYFPAPWGEIKTIAQFNDDVANATKALALAKRMNVPEFYYESLVVHGYITALRALYELKSLVVSGAVAPANRALAANYFYIYVAGIKEAQDALPKWEQAIGGSGGVASWYSLLATDISQMTSLASSLGCPIGTSFTLVPATTIAEAKTNADGTFVSLGAELVTSTTNGMYIQESGGAPAGIKLQTSLSASLNTPYSILGTMGTSNGERYVNATMILPISASLSARPVAMKTSSVGGGAFGLQPAVWEFRTGSAAATAGLSNVGIQVKIAGKVTAHGTDWFYLDDGCGLSDGSGYTGIRVLCGSLTKPGIGSYVTVTGPSSTYYERSHAWRAIVATSASSIVPI